MHSSATNAKGPPLSGAISRVPASMPHRPAAAMISIGTPPLGVLPHGSWDPIRSPPKPPPRTSLMLHPLGVGRLGGGGGGKGGGECILVFCFRVFWGMCFFRFSSGPVTCRMLQHFPSIVFNIPLHCYMSDQHPQQHRQQIVGNKI